MTRRSLFVVVACLVMLLLVVWNRAADVQPVAGSDLSESGSLSSGGIESELSGSWPSGSQADRALAGGVDQAGDTAGLSEGVTYELQMLGAVPPAAKGHLIVGGKPTAATRDGRFLRAQVASDVASPAMWRIDLAPTCLVIVRNVESRSIGVALPQLGPAAFEVQGVPVGQRWSLTATPVGDSSDVDVGGYVVHGWQHSSVRVSEVGEVSVVTLAVNEEGIDAGASVAAQFPVGCVLEFAVDTDFYRVAPESGTLTVPDRAIAVAGEALPTVAVIGRFSAGDRLLVHHPRMRGCRVRTVHADRRRVRVPLLPGPAGVALDVALVRASGELLGASAATDTSGCATVTLPSRGNPVVTIALGEARDGPIRALLRQGDRWSWAALDATSACFAGNPFHFAEHSDAVVKVHSLHALQGVLLLGATGEIGRVRDGKCIWRSAVAVVPVAAPDLYEVQTQLYFKLLLVIDGQQMPVETGRLTWGELRARSFRLASGERYRLEVLDVETKKVAVLELMR